MKKNISCPSCNGNGFRTIITGDRNDYCGIVSEMCSACGGTGVQEADMTNADLIRTMSDEELAEFLYTVFLDEEGSKSRITEWLKQPAGVEE